MAVNNHTSINLLFKEDIPFKKTENHLFSFIDLFAGIGGFRIALQNLGGNCLFTSEWDKEAQKTYAINFGDIPFGDITQSEIKNHIPQNFDVLCAGFPCQPFSKGGFRNGFEDTRGTLFFDICEIVDKHKPKYLLLENVANLVSHDNGNTFKTILKNLDALGYLFPDKPLLLSPDKYGVPILRPRVYIPCVRKDIAKGKMSFIKNFNITLTKLEEEAISIDAVIDNTIQNQLSLYEEKILEMWNSFYQGIDIKIIGFPVWVDYFKFTEDINFFPEWKQKFIIKNIDLYKRNKKFIEEWLEKYENLEWCVNTHKKMEWQAGDQYKSIYDCLIQFRPSGVRVKRPDKFSTLVAMNHQQIIGKLKRKLTIDESKLLQSFPVNYKLSSNINIAMKQLGNSVNVKVVQLIFEQILKYYDSNRTS